MTFKSFALAAVLAGASVVSAQAATIGLEGQSQSSKANAPTLAVVGNAGIASFSWFGTPSSSYLTFSVSSGFELFLDSYTNLSDTPKNLQTSGYVFKNISSTPAVTYTNQTSHCAGAVAPMGSQCNHFATAEYNGPLSVVRPNDSLGTYAAGTYLLGVYDSSAPYSASATFRIAAVPLPATGLALIAGLGGLAALGARRRRQQA